MYKLLPVLILCVSCTPAEPDHSPTPASMGHTYATQTSAPTPDYRSLLDQAGIVVPQGGVREATSVPPRDAQRIGSDWIARLEQRGALLGHGLADSSENAAVSMIDTGMTEREFDRWIQDNGWSVPGHIRWSFVAEMTHPAVSDATQAAIRYWPASTARTGAQLQALHSGRIELRDGCFFVGERGQPANKLAWFHAETGLDIDDAGYLILRDRVDGTTRARIGEDLSWAGPASAQIDDQAGQALHEACGPGEILVVRSPESTERFEMRVADLRSRNSRR